MERINAARRVVPRYVYDPESKSDGAEPVEATEVEGAVTSPPGHHVRGQRFLPQARHSLQPTL